MGTSNYSDEFKRDAVQQIRVRGHPVREVSRRPGVSAHSLDKWMKLFAEPAPKASGVDHAAENRRLKRDLARVTDLSRIRKQSGGLFSRRMATSKKRVSHGAPLVQVPRRCA